jgi:membrane protein DedA with SNARE-associated domain
VIPVVRCFISVPAGLAEMKRGRFVILTTIGSALWVALLCGLGYAAGKNWHHVAGDFHDAQWPIVFLIVVVLVAGLWHRIRTVQRQRTD